MAYAGALFADNHAVRVCVSQVLERLIAKGGMRKEVGRCRGHSVLATLACDSVLMTAHTAASALKSFASKRHGASMFRDADLSKVVKAVLSMASRGRRAASVRHLHRSSRRLRLNDSDDGDQFSALIVVQSLLLSCLELVCRVCFPMWLCLCSLSPRGLAFTRTPLRSSIAMLAE